MNRIIAATALTLVTLTGAASAMTPDAGLTEIRKHAPLADLSVLSDAEVRSLLNVIHSGDSNSEIRAAVRNTIRKAS